MRILWCSAFSAETGYGNQARLFVPRIQQAGHKIAVLEIGNQYRKPQEVNGIKIFSAHHDPLLNDTVAGYVQTLEIDAVITLVDVWKFNPHVWKQFPTFNYVPIDHYPAPPTVTDFLRHTTRPIAMSRFGQNALQEQGIESLFMPHGIDCETFYPQDRSACRAALGFEEDIFLAAFVGINDSVPSRKGIGELLTAWSIFARSHPDARLYMHTLMHGNLPLSNTGGIQIDRLIKTLDIPAHSVYMPNQDSLRQHVPSSKIAQLMNAADVLVAPSRGEGCGLPALEAQACGTPVIVTNFGAQAEFGLTGWKVEFEAEWTWQNSFWAKPGIASIVEGLEAAYAARGDTVLRQQAHERMREYEINHVFETYTKPVLREIGELILSKGAAQVTAREQTKQQSVNGKGQKVGVQA